MNDFSGRDIAIRHDTQLQVNYIDLVFPSLSLKDDMLLRIQQNIALIILGRLRTSRLFQLLRYEKGLVYSISASDSQWPGLGYAYITSEVSSEHIDEVIKLIVKELAVFIKDGPTEKELEFTKHYLSNSWLMAFDNPGSIADWISEDFLWKDKILLPEDYIEIVKKITVKDLVTVMQKWDMSKLQLIIQGPIENSEKKL
jgi:predicted Zn-dependent peptidase